MSQRHPLDQLAAPPYLVDGKTLDQISDERIAAELRRIRLLAIYQPKHIQQAIYAQAITLTRSQQHTKDENP